MAPIKAMGDSTAEGELYLHHRIRPMTGIVIAAAAFLLFPLHNPACANEAGCSGKASVKYLYEAVPKGKSGKVSAEISIPGDATSLDYISRFNPTGEKEEIHITVTKDGKFISGSRTRSDASRRQLNHERVRVDRATMEVEVSKEGEKDTKQIEIPKSRELAVDGSLLMLLRSFPFDQEKQWELFMVDFSSVTFTMTVSQAGKERVVVPAGEFDCYRIEAVVNIPLLRPKVIYWITVAQPHFLVKHQGKRGPFTPEYVTSLVSMTREE